MATWMTCKIELALAPISGPERKMYWRARATNGRSQHIVAYSEPFLEASASNQSMQEQAKQQIINKLLEAGWVRAGEDRFMRAME